MGESKCKRRAHEGSNTGPAAAASNGAEAGHSVRKVLYAPPAYGDSLSQKTSVAVA